MAALAFVGLGVMGFPMAGHLARAGHAVSVFNRDPAKSERWAAAHRGRVALSGADAARGAEAVFLCLGNDDSVRGVVLGEQGLLAAMAPGSVLVDHTTASAALARELSLACAVRGVGWVDAPVSGGQAGAENGTLTIMCGGEAAHFGAVEPFLAVYARCARLLGAAGSGQLAKMVNQICIAGIVQGLAEGLHFARSAGLDAHAVIDVIREEGIVPRAEAMGERFRAHVGALAADAANGIGEIRGLGAMVAFEIVKPDTHEPDADRTKAVTARAAELGLVLLSCGVYYNTIRVLVPITASDVIFEEGLAILSRAIAETR